MELKSEPTYETVSVTDIDIAFPGDLQTFTLRDGVDEYWEAFDLLTIKFGSGGFMTFSKRLAHYIAIRPRTIRVVVPVAQSGQSAAAPLPSSTE